MAEIKTEYEEFNFSELLKERLEEHGFKMKLYNWIEFEKKHKLDIPDQIWYKNAAEVESICEYPKGSINLFEGCHFGQFIFFNWRVDPNSKTPCRYGELIKILCENPLRYKDELEFNYKPGPKRVKGNSWSWMKYQDGWYELFFYARYLKGKKIITEADIESIKIKKKIVTGKKK